MSQVSNQVGDVDREFQKANALLDRILNLPERAKRLSPEDLWREVRDWLTEHGDDVQDLVAATHAACIVRLARRS
ncbi:Uncharacterised protein [Mycobacteroides abscessus]|nr:Uncharacterised protein [Mycobacteroides abscessus]